MNFKKVVAKFLAIICVTGIIAISLPVESFAVEKSEEICEITPKRGFDIVDINKNPVN